VGPRHIRGQGRRPCLLDPGEPPPICLSVARLAASGTSRRIVRSGRGHVETPLRVMLCGRLGKEEEEEGRGGSRVVVFITCDDR